MKAIVFTEVGHSDGYRTSVNMAKLYHRIQQGEVQQLIYVIVVE